MFDVFVFKLVGTSVQTSRGGTEHQDASTTRFSQPIHGVAV
jgi:hypothetical protein